MEVISKSSSSYASSSEGKHQSRRASFKRVLFRHFRPSRIHQKNKSTCRNNQLMKADSIARVSKQDGVNVLSQSGEDDNGVVRMKILVRKEDLNQVLEMMRNNNNNNNNNPSKTNNNNKNAHSGGGDDVEDDEGEAALLLIEERLNQLRKKHRRQNSWSPALHTIPEEIFAFH